MNLSKKTKIIIIVALAAVLVIGACTFFGIRMTQDAKSRSHYANYDDFSKELTVLVEFLQIQYPEHKHQPTYLRVADGKELLEPNVGFVRIPEEIRQILTVLSRGCFTSEKAKLFAISFHGSRIQFDTENGAYALVYSPEGKPEYLHSEGENIAIRVERINENWYHVTRVE